MQTTLLGFAIAIILALVAALVGPLFIDWGSYRGEFEARASRLTGLEFRVTGPIDARLLPTPIIVLQGIEFGRPGEASRVRARALRIEFALGALVRGEWRIADARLEGPEFAAGLDGSSRLAWPVPQLGSELGGVAIERLQIEDGRAVLGDAASDSHLTLEKLDFNGELRSLAGPIKGEGSFVVAGRHYPYRLSASRIAEDGGMKVRLAVDPIDNPLAAEADATIWIDHAKPRFEGSIQLGRSVGRAPAGGQALIVDSWRASAHVKGDSSAAVLEQIEFQYGPDDRAIKLKGSAKLTLGQRPEINAALSSSQIDVDRVLELPEAVRRRPLAAVRTLAESLVAASRLPIPATLSIRVESVTLGGSALARVGVDVKADADGLDIKGLELRAPGITQVRLSGRLGATSTGPRFAGSARIEAADPRTFLAWLSDRSDEQSVIAGPLRLGGDVTVGNDAVAVDRLKLELDRMTVAGRLAYAWASEDRPARFDVSVAAPEIDLDRVHALARAVFGDAALDWPREGTLALKVDRASIAGVEAKRADVNMRIGANGLEIERFAIADFGGAALAAKGRIDTGTQPRGALTLDLDARNLDGLIPLLERLAPQAADQLRRAAGRLTPVALRASLAVDPIAGSEGANAKLKADGRAGAFRIALESDVGGPSEALKLDHLTALETAKIGLSARIDGDDGAALAELVGLDRFIAVDKRPAHLVLAAKGQFDGELAVSGQFAAGALNVSTSGTIRVSDRARPTAGLNVKVSNANIRSPRPVAAGRPVELLPTSVNAGLDLIEGRLHLTGMAGTVAGSSVRGRLVLGIQQQPITVDGDIEVGTVSLPPLIELAIGMPAQTAGASVGTSAAASGGPSGLWPAEPFEQGLVGLRGQIAVTAARVAFTPKLSAQDVRGVVHFGDTQLALQVIDGKVAGGRVAGELVFLRHGEELIARSRIGLTDANAAELLPGEGVLSGRLTLRASTEGTGMSPVALVGSLSGSGTFKLENARLVRLDPTAFDTVIRAVDRGLPIDAVRIRDRMDAALASGVLAVPLAEGAISIDAGQARLSNTTVRAQRADLAVSGGVSLAEGAVDARLTLLGAAAAGAPANSRPEVLIALKGPVDTPRRSIDVAALASWLALRAVEQQSKKLEVLEGRDPGASPARPASNANPQTAPAQRAPAAEPAAPREPGPAAPRPQSTSAQTPKPAAPAAERVPTLPPPIDIRPAPVPRSPRPQGAAGHPQPQRPAATAAPPRPRSLSEILFGN
ncbi:MAG TPA: AsmA family protein [Xanthobacteraceae bacterium]